MHMDVENELSPLDGTLATKVLAERLWGLFNFPLQCSWAVWLLLALKNAFEAPGVLRKLLAIGIFILNHGCCAHLGFLYFLPLGR